MKSNEIRASFLKYFADRGHKIVKSSPLIPQDDPTLLFINAGMNQFKNVFTGLETRDYKTAVSSQKCIRAGGKHNDLENVGFTARHHTFFEMLGNFSFGDYFKEEAIAYAWEFVTKDLGLDPSRLYATVYTDDDEAEKLWKSIAPDLGDRVLRFGEKDNFWSMGPTGPCGPCSELHYDLGDKFDGELNGEGDKFMEIWNLVFMQYDRDDSGKMTPLPKPSVDTGAGLERICMILQDGATNYETDLFSEIIEKIAKISGFEYSLGPEGVSHRVISDHIRALTFAIADGGKISNEGRGYVLRRILRRAARHGRLLDLREPFIYKLVDPLVNLMGEQYPEIKSKKEHIELVLKTEEEQFGRTLDTGLEIFEDIIKKVNSKGLKIVPGKDVFKLYDTFGFPVDLTEVMTQERGLSVDMAGYEEELAKQKEISKKESKFVSKGLEIKWGILPESKFVGSNKEVVKSKILFRDKMEDKLYLVLDQTPFYPESGGQVGDKGIIECGLFRFIVSDTQKAGKKIIHLGYSDETSLPSDAPDTFIMNDEATAKVDHEHRADIKRNHTATHLLHKALRDTLGDHVHQAGSLVAPDKLRFDYTHPKGLTVEEIDSIEKTVNDKIKDDLNVTAREMSFDQAKYLGAMALFGEKYGDEVRVITTGDDYSIELCGGTHVDSTADIGEFIITQETAIAAGMRRIEALTGREALKFSDDQSTIVEDITKIINSDLKSLSDDDISSFKNMLSAVHKRTVHKLGLTERIAAFQKRLDKHQKQKTKDEAGRMSKQAGELTSALRSDAEAFVIYLVPTDNSKDLMVYSDKFKVQNPGMTIVTISDKNGNLVITSKDQENGQKIFKEIGELTGARGGGKGTIRGSMPVDKIELLLQEFSKKYV